ncbi:hypothetical protein [Streptomyces sp. NPDC087300]|uniref:hypothetical protein n=1 Tax=Streptomyces sp. NPDC087300 TaxID=3365780 RepID=UPI0038018225
MTTPHTTRSGHPQFELRCGGLHITVQPIPARLIGLITTTGGAAVTWWTSH